MSGSHLQYCSLILVSVLLAGCSTPFVSTPAEEFATLGSVDIRNVDTEPHSVDVLIERNGTIAYWTTVEIDAKHGDTLGSAIAASKKFVDQPGDYVIKARLDRRTTGSEFSLSTVGESGCYIVQIRIEENETLTFATAQDAYECHPG